MKVLALCALFLAAFAALVSAGNVVELTPDTFDSVVDGSKHVLVEFFAPWCGHCKNLAPIYEELAGAFAGNKDVVIASVDADAHRSLGSRYGVTGFPTIKFFAKGSTEAQDYKSGRDLDSFLTFISDNTGARGKKAVAKEYTTVLTDANFDEIVFNSGKDVLVEFYAPWCGHCKTLAPKYEKVAFDFSRDDNVVIAKIDADKYKDIGGRYGVSGFPTIKFFPKGAEKPEDYTGGREEADFVSFINNRCGTLRVPGGALNENAGRISKLDDLVSQFFNKEKRQEAIQKVKEHIAQFEDKTKERISQLEDKTKERISKLEEKAAIFYSKFMDKIHGTADAGKKFVKDEIERIERMLEGKGISADKQDEFSIRKNILKVFQKHQEN